MLDKRDISVFSLSLILSFLLTACAGNTVRDDNNEDEDDISEIAHTPKKQLRHIPKAGPLIKVSYQPQTAPVSSILKPNRSVKKFNKINYIQKYKKTRRVKHDTWDRIFSRFRLGDQSRNPRVQAIIKEYARKPKKLAIITRRASPYLYMIVSEVERRGMPAEIALLPFVESGFNPKAYSHSGAAGLWQFIPSTGKLYGLPRNHQFDARLDSFAATHAALNYLQKLQRQFKGDWLLALAAYNAGEGTVSRVIKKFKRQHPGEPINFWNLKLPAQTMRYVPKLFAYKEVLLHAKQYRFRLPNIPNKPQLVQLRINKPINLRLLASRSGLHQSVLTDLNPYFLKGVSTPKQSNRITLPRRYTNRIKKAIRNLPPAYANHTKTARQRYTQKQDRFPKQRYAVRKGVNLPKAIRPS